MRRNSTHERRSELREVSHVGMSRGALRARVHEFEKRIVRDWRTNEEMFQEYEALLRQGKDTNRPWMV